MYIRIIILLFLIFSLKAEQLGTKLTRYEIDEIELLSCGYEADSDIMRRLKYAQQNKDDFDVQFDYRYSHWDCWLAVRKKRITIKHTFENGILIVFKYNNITDDPKYSGVLDRRKKFKKLLMNLAEKGLVTFFNEYNGGVCVLLSKDQIYKLPFYRSFFLIGSIEYRSLSEEEFDWLRSFAISSE